MTTQIAGYDYGAAGLARSPVAIAELDLMKATVLFTAEDADHLRKAGDVLADQIEDVLDVWYGFVASQPHLVEYFADRSGKPLGEYLQAVRERFGQWIRDTCRAQYDQKWLDYQHEIALRHTSTKKNRTDKVDARTSHIPLRYMIAFVYPITATMKPFLGKRGHSPEEVEKMHQAWFKAVVLQVGLWSQPYAREGTF
jgi:hypothetical protein